MPPLLPPTRLPNRPSPQLPQLVQRLTLLALLPMRLLKRPTLPLPQQHRRPMPAQLRRLRQPISRSRNKRIAYFCTS